MRARESCKVIELVLATRQHLVEGQRTSAAREDLVVHRPMFVRHGDRDHIDDSRNEGIALDDGVQLIGHVVVDEVGEGARGRGISEGPPYP